MLTHEDIAKVAGMRGVEVFHLRNSAGNVIATIEPAETDKSGAGGCGWRVSPRFCSPTMSSGWWRRWVGRCRRECVG